MLTDNLRLELQTTVAAVNRWAEKQCDTLDFHKLTFDKSVEEFECTVTALNETNQELENMRPQQAQIKKSQAAEVSDIRAEIDRTTAGNAKLSAEMQRLKQEEVELHAQLQEKTRAFEHLRAEAAKAANDRKFGLAKFTSGLGLKFEKAKNDSIKFIFSNVVRGNAAMECYFVIRVDESDVYQLMEVFPAVQAHGYSAQQTDAEFLIDQLNQDNEIGRFAVLMRKMFKDNL
jgi:hypothetical protein